MQAIVRDYQPHPAKRAILHLDLQRVVATEKLRMTIPLHFINQELSPGVKLGGASVSHLLTELEVSCLPKDLPEYIEVDIAPMQLNDMLHIRDLKLPEGVEVPGFVAEFRQRPARRARARPARRRGSRGRRRCRCRRCCGACRAPRRPLPADKAGDKAGGDKAKAAAKPAAKGDKK